MAISSSIGLATGLDTASLISQLVAAERAPAENRINRLGTEATATLSALGTVSAAFDTLQSAVEALNADGALDTRSVEVGDDKTLTASVENGATAGTYSVTVHQVATSHKLASGALDPEASLGAGTFTLRVGDESVEVSLTAEDSTPEKLRDAINSAAAELGVSASLVTADDGVHLVLTSTQTGVENAITVESDTGNQALDDLFGGLAETVAAQDAIVEVDGLTRTSSSNSIADLTPGTTLQIKAPGTTTVTVDADTEAASALMEDFVAAYNAAIEAIGTATAYDAETGTAGALTGDAQMRGASSQLRNALSAGLGTAAGLGLTSGVLGLTTNVDGTLEFDSAAFGAALSESPSAVKIALGGDEGLLTGVSQVLAGYVGEDGAFQLRTDSLNRQIDDYSTQLDDLDRRMEAVEAQYTAEFTALEILVAELNTTSSYLSQQLEALSTNDS